MFAYKIATIALFAVFARGCDSKIIVDKVPAGEPKPPNGVIYALPKTVARVQLKVDQTTAQGAIYSPFAAIFAPDGDPVCKYENFNETEYNACVQGVTTYGVQKGVKVTPYGEVDPNQVFLVRFMGKSNIDQSLSMTWSDTGLLTGASATVTNRTGDIALSVLKTVTGLGIKAALGAKVPGIVRTNCGSDDSVTPDSWIVPLLDTKAGNSADELIANYCSIKRDDRKKFPNLGTAPAFHFTNNQGVYVQRSFAYLLESAVRAYTGEVERMTQTRTSILEGNNQIFQSADLLPHIEAEISKRLTRLFLGSKQTLTWEGTVEVRDFDSLNPTDLDNPAVGGLLDVIHINEKVGICLKSPLAPDSEPIPKKFNILTATCNAAPAIKLRVNYFPVSNAQLFTRVAPSDEAQQSFRYRVPAQVSATLCDSKIVLGKSVCDEQKKSYGSAVFSVAQLGKVISLPVTRHSKTLTYDLTLIDSTGALKTFKLSSAGGLDPATIEALGGVAGSVIEARQKGDEINKLTRQQQLLKLQDDICTIQKKYGLPCTVQPE